MTHRNPTCCHVFETLDLDSKMDLESALDRSNRHGPGRPPLQGRLNMVPPGIHLLAVKEGMQAKWLAARLGLSVENREVDAVADEAFHLMHVETFADPLGQQSFGRRAMGADFAHVALLHVRGIHGETQHRERGLREGLLQ